MPKTLKSAMLLALAAATLATPAVAAGRSTGPQIVMHSTRPVSFYRESLRAQLQVDARLYSTPAPPSGSGSNAFGYVLVACLVVLVAAGALGASRRERRGAPARVVAAH
jgi:hypothetical protein